MKQARDAPWDRNEHIVTYIDRVEQEVKKLKRGKVKSDENDLLSQMLYEIKKSGEMEHALRRWEDKAEADKTWKMQRLILAKSMPVAANMPKSTPKKQDSATQTKRKRKCAPSTKTSPCEK